MKKIMIFSSIILILFAAIIFLTKYQQNQDSKDNPYGKKRSSPRDGEAAG